MKTTITLLLLLMATTSCVSRNAGPSAAQATTSETLASTYPWDRDKGIADLIKLGDTMANVEKFVGDGKWPGTCTREKLVADINEHFAMEGSSHRAPESAEASISNLPARGKYFEWRCQGFGTTGYWLVIYFAAEDNGADAPLRVVARGIFPLGCY
jgi:hypothetical protein